MHLFFFSRFIPSVDAGVVIDDFGDEHRLITGGGFGLDSAYWAAIKFKWDAEWDPDFWHVLACEPLPFRIREDIKLTGPFGIELDATLGVDFTHVPAWDWDRAVPLHDAADGARIDIERAYLEVDGGSWDERVSVDPASISAICWAHVAKEREQLK